MNSKTSSNTSSSQTPQNASAEINAALEPCFTDPPTAGAIIIICDDDGTAYYSLNLHPIDVTKTLLDAATRVVGMAGTHIMDAPEVVQ